jgi:hypothetical protein
MTRQRLVHLAIAAALIAVSAPAAHAQYAGDMFFATPSVAVAEGGTATMEADLFSGSVPLGAAQFDLLYDPSQVEVVSVDAGGTQELENGVASAPVSPGRTGIVALNGASLDHPFGTESLARVTFRPLVPAGSYILLQLAPRSLLRTDSTPFPAGRGFYGELVVVSAGPATAQSQAPLTGDQVDSDHQSRALRLRRPGNLVSLIDLEQKGGKVLPVATPVVVPDPAAASEASKP